MWSHLLGSEMARCERRDHRLSCCVVELNISPPAGDENQALHAQNLAGDALRSDVRRYDSVGDSRDRRFLVVMPETGLRMGCHVAERLQARVGSALGSSTAGSPPAFFGVTEWTRQESSHQLLATAEAALHAARDTDGTGVAVRLQPTESGRQPRTAVSRGDATAGIEPPAIGRPTGCLDASRVIEVLDIEINRCRRQRHPLACCLLGIGGATNAGSSTPREGSDRLMPEIAAALTETARPYDSVGRLGADEFAIVLPETAMSAARSVCDRMASAARSAARRPTGAPTRLSVGFAQWTSEANASELLGTAGRALQRAKQGGGKAIAVRLGSSSRRLL